MNEGFDDAHELKDLRASRIIKVGFEKNKQQRNVGKSKLSKSMR